MEYIIAEEAKASGFETNEIGRISAKPEFRPRVGQIVRLSSKPNQDLRITRCIPSDNPATGSVTYVIQYMSDLHTIAGGDVSNFEQYYLRTG